MAFLRFSRDKRGYEHFYLVEATTNRRGKTRARVLYWFRTPPGVKVGREPFDADVRQALEAQNPDVVFDWRKIVETPLPSADAEKWRERRRLEKAEKAARRARAADQPGESVPDAEALDSLEEGEEQSPEGDDVGVDAAERQEDSLPPVIDLPAAAPTTRRRRRKRRGSRGPSSSQGSGSQGSGPQGSSA